MSRLSRVFIDNACYHIITRGNRKQEVFKNDGDFEVYLHILKKAKKRYKILLYAYCLMPNHIHLLVGPKLAQNISLFMHWVSRGYAAYFNTKYETVGHLWQGRFKSKPIMQNEYLINCATYIENNPLRASLIDDIIKYRWTSYAERCLSSKKIMLDEIQLDDE